MAEDVMNKEQWNSPGLTMYICLSRQRVKFVSPATDLYENHFNLLGCFSWQMVASEKKGKDVLTLFILFQGHRKFVMAYRIRDPHATSTVSCRFSTWQQRSITGWTQGRNCISVKKNMHAWASFVKGAVHKTASLGVLEDSFLQSPGHFPNSYRLDQEDTDKELRNIFERLKKETGTTEGLTQCLQIENSKLARAQGKYFSFTWQLKIHCLINHHAVNQQHDAAECLELILRRVSQQASEVSAG